MDTTMTDLQQIPPESGWYAAALLAAAGLLKGAWPWLKSRDAAAHRLTAAERAAQREEDRDLVLTLKEMVVKHEGKIKALEERLDTSLQLITVLTRDKAEALAKLDHANAEVSRIRRDRDHYRSLALDGQRVAERAGQTTAAETLAEEISEADEATSFPGLPSRGKP